MKTSLNKYRLLPTLGLTLMLFGCETVSDLPQTTGDGLVLVKDTRADAVYLRPGISLAGYTKIALVEPQISFRTNWQSDTNHGRMMNKVSDEQVAQMIATGKKLLAEEFTAELTKGGYTVVEAVGPDVLAVKAGVLDLDIQAPDPDNMNMWVKTYTSGSGSATMAIELYDSVTWQLLVRAYDHKSDGNGGSAWAFPRDKYSNLNDARFALNAWAKMLVKGLDQAKAAKKT